MTPQNLDITLSKPGRSLYNALLAEPPNHVCRKLVVLVRLSRAPSVNLLEFIRDAGDLSIFSNRISGLRAQQHARHYS